MILLSKKFVFFFCFLTANLFIHSQIKLGVKTELGLNIPSYSVSSDTINKPTAKGIGYSLGGFIEMPLSENGLHFLGELLLTSKGYQTTVNKEVSQQDINVKNEEHGTINPFYISSLLLIKYNIKMNTGRYGSDNFLCFFAGPNFSFKIADQYSIDKTTKITLYDQETVYTESTTESDIDYKLFNLGISAGVMYDWQKGLRIGLRYYRTISPINDNTNYKITHSGLMVTAGWTLTSK